MRKEKKEDEEREMTGSSRREKKLYKDPNDKMIAGVASGFAKYFDIDTTLVRVVWVVLGLGGVGILLYVILWIVLEDEPEDLEVPRAEAVAGETSGNDVSTVTETDESGEPSETDEGEAGKGEKLPEADEVGETNQQAGDIRSG